MRSIKEIYTVYTLLENLDENFGIEVEIFGCEKEICRFGF